MPSPTLPRLKIVDLHEVPDLSVVEDPAVQVWRDEIGSVFAYCHTIEGRHWVQLPGWSSFAFDDQAAEVEAFPQPGVAEEVVADIYRRSALPLVMQARGTEVLHSSAVRTPQGVVAFCAARRVGKSTLAYGLSLRGYPVWADDAVAWDLHGRLVRALPLPFRLRLRPTSAAYFGCGRSGIAAPRLADATPTETDPPATLAGVCLLQQDPAADGAELVELSRLAPSRAFPALLEHSYCFSLQNTGRKRRLIRNYLGLSAEVPVFELRFSAGLQLLPRIMDEVERVVVNNQEPESVSGRGLSTVASFSETSIDSSS